MAYPQQQQQQQPQVKKKVEWSTNLSSSEPQQTENSNPDWDSEADHNMLSYFLDGNGLATPPQPSNRFPATAGGADAGVTISSRGNQSVVSDRILQHPFRTDSFSGGQPGRSMAMRQENNDLRQPPPTPVIQHYFHKKSSKSSSGNSRSSAMSSGTQMPRQTQQSPFTQQHTHQQHQQHQLIQQQIDPIQATKQNFMGAYHQQFNPSAGSVANNHNSFQGYNARMEEPTESISPALEFGGYHEPLLLPGKGGVVTQLPKQQTTSNPDFSSQVHSLAGTIHGSTYGIPIGNPTAAPMTSNSSMQPENVNKGQAPVLSSQAAAAVAQLSINFSQSVIASQKQLAQSISSGDSTSVNPNPAVSSVGIFPQPIMGAPTINPSAVSSAVLLPGVGGNHPFFYPHHLTTAYLMQKAESAEETEEKRAKRLERNRESARKSRRRKKDRLINLEGKVNKVYSKIENERRVQINSMDTAWKAIEMEELMELKRLHTASLNQSIGTESEEKIQAALSRLFISEKEQSTRKEIVEFQYNALAQHLLPRYQKFFLWTILQDGAYFLSGKEEHAKREFSKKITTGKISSKQLGEEISNGRKQPRRKKGESTSLNQDQIGNDQTACVSESEKLWPLVCFELSVSVEQEERFLEVHERSRKAESLHKNVSQIEAATRLASNAKECILYQIYMAAFRKRKTYNDILTPRQAILYHEWLLSNKDRVRNLVSNRRKRASSIQRGGFASQAFDEGREEDLTLEELCRYLEESLKISKNLAG